MGIVLLFETRLGRIQLRQYCQLEITSKHFQSQDMIDLYPMQINADLSITFINPEWGPIKINADQYREPNLYRSALIGILCPAIWPLMPPTLPWWEENDQHRNTKCTVLNRNKLDSELSVDEKFAKVDSVNHVEMDRRSKSTILIWSGSRNIYQGPCIFDHISGIAQIHPYPVLGQLTKVRELLRCKIIFVVEGWLERYCSPFSKTLTQQHKIYTQEHGQQNTCFGATCQSKGSLT